MYETEEENQTFSHKSKEQSTTPHTAVERASLMDLDLHLDGSWPFDQFLFTNPSSPFFLPSSEQPLSPLWAFSDDEAAGNTTSTLAEGNPNLVNEIQAESGDKRRPPPQFLGLTPQDYPDWSCVIKERMAQALRCFKESTDQNVLVQLSRSSPHHEAESNEGELMQLVLSEQVPFGGNVVSAIQSSTAMSHAEKKNTGETLQRKHGRNETLVSLEDQQHFGRGSNKSKMVNGSEEDSMNLCHGNDPTRDLCSSSTRKESLEARGSPKLTFQLTELTSTTAYSTPTPLALTKSQKNLGGILSGNMESSNDLRYLFPSESEMFFEGQINESVWTELSCSDPALKQAIATLPHSVPLVTTGKNVGIVTTLQNETENLMTAPCGSSASELLPSLQALTQPSLLAEKRMTQSLRCLTESTAQHHLDQGHFLEEQRSIENINQSMDDKLELVLQCVLFPQPTRSSLCPEAFSNGVEIMQLDSVEPHSFEKFDATNYGGKVVSEDKSCTAIYHPEKKYTIETRKRKCRVDLEEDLPIEVIDFDNGEKLCSIQNGGGMVQLDASNLQPVDPINGGRNVGSGEQCDIAVTHSQEKGVLKMLGRPKCKNGIQISLEYLQQHAEMKLIDAAKCLKVSRSTLKRICRKFGIARWPPCKIKKDSHSLPIESVQGVEQEQMLELCSNVPSKQASATVSHTEPPPRAMQDANMVTIKAKHVNDIIITFELSLPWRLVELQHQVAKRLNLEGGTYYIKFKDVDNDLILIACDDDLEKYICTCRLQGSSSIEVFLQPK